MGGIEYKNARVEVADLTLEEASARIGISTSYLSRIENDKVVPRKDVIKKMAEVYGVSLTLPDALFAERGELTVEPHVLGLIAAAKAVASLSLETRIADAPLGFCVVELTNALRPVFDGLQPQEFAQMLRTSEAIVRKSVQSAQSTARRQERRDAKT